MTQHVPREHAVHDLQQGTRHRSAVTDEFAEVAIDASRVIGIAAANSKRAIPEPILNGMKVFEIEAPDPDPDHAVALRRAWMTAFGNARMAGRGSIHPADLPCAGGKRQAIGFMQ